LKKYRILVFKAREQPMIKMIKKREALYGIIIAGLLIFLFYNQYLESKHGKSFFASLNDLKMLTQQEKDWLKDKGVIYYGFRSDDAPLEFIDEKDDVYKGILIDYIHALSEEIGVEIKPVPIENAEAGDVSLHKGVDIITKIPIYSKENSYLYTYPILRIRGAVLLPKDRVGKKDLETLKQVKNVAVIAEGTNVFLSGNTPWIAQVPASNIESALEMVKRGQVEGIAGIEMILQQKLKRLGLERDFAFISHPGYEMNYVFAVDPSNQILFNILNKGIHNLQSKNILEDIQREWFGLSSSLSRENISTRIALTILIFSMAISLILYYFYLSNKTLFRELEERMEELNISRNELQITFDSLTHLMIVVDQFFMILNTNDAVCKYLQIHKSHIIGKYCMQFPQLDPFFSGDMYKNLKKAFEEGMACQQEITHEGSIFEVNIFPVKDCRKQISKILVMIKDITQIRIHERQFLQENKMAAVGQLAAGIAHEIRNPLGLIRNYCYILKNGSAEDTRLMAKAIKNIESAVQKAGAIIDNLLNFSRISDEEWETVNLRDYVDMVLMLHDNEIKKNAIHVELDCDSDLRCRVNAGALEIILVNLIANAVDAMPDGGSLYLGCNVRENALEILCKDTGVGIEQEKLSKIFEPFFTTKEKRKGTGLGLYLTYNEIQKWGGKINVDSRLGEGTTFSVWLPLSQGGDRNHEKGLI